MALFSSSEKKTSDGALSSFSSPYSNTSSQNSNTIRKNTPAAKKKPEEESRDRMVQQSLSAITAQLALLEDRYGQVRNKVNFADHELIETKSKINKQIKVLDDELNGVNRTIQEIREKVEGLYDEVSRAARKEEVDVLEKYLDLWEPVEFVTREELSKIITGLKNQEKNSKTATQTR